MVYLVFPRESSLEMNSQAMSQISWEPNSQATNYKKITKITSNPTAMFVHGTHHGMIYALHGLSSRQSFFSLKFVYKVYRLSTIWVILSGCDAKIVEGIHVIRTPGT
jgi:hypothetical protein